MVNLLNLVLFLLATTTACITQSKGDTNETPPLPSKSLAANVLPPTAKTKGGTLDCVRSINEFGKASQCRCTGSLVYNPITGDCEKGGRMCTMSLTDMFNEKTGQCYMARNGCEASDLKTVGWREKLDGDTCKDDLKK